MSSDPQYFNGDVSSNHIDRFNALRFKESSTEIIAEFPDFYHLEPFPRLREIRRHLFTMLSSVEKYNRFAGSSPTDFDGSTTDPLSGIVVSFQDLTAAEPRMVHILVAFTWFSESPTISGSVRIRQDVRTADKRLMRMLYKIGNRFLNADVLIPDREVSENFSYMNFNPFFDKFYDFDDYRFYQSNMRNVEKYFVAIRYIMEHPDIPWGLLRILSLAIIYDFMSVCAQLLRDALQMQAEESQTRANVVFTLHTYRSNAHFLDQIVFHDAFSAIISNIKPMSPVPQSYALKTSPITTSYSRMSAINREDLLSETTDHTEENDDENDDDDDEYSDDESESDDEDMTPPTSSSDHHRRCQEDLIRYNHSYVMGHKRSLWASIQTDTKRPARRRIIKTSDDNTSSSMNAPPLLQDPPLASDVVIPALKTTSVPRMTVPSNQEGRAAATATKASPP